MLPRLPRLRRLAAPVALSLGLTVGLTAVTTGVVVPSAPTAEAHSFGSQGPPHTHLTNPGCTAYDCWRWLLVNGAILQGPAYHLSGQMPLVLVVCSHRVSGPGGIQIWVWNNERLGSANTPGYAAAYCQLPAYNNGQTPWSVKSP